MGCFAAQKAKKKQEVHHAQLNGGDDDTAEVSSSPPSLSPVASLKQPASERPSFRKVARAIRNAQRFISHSNPGRSSSNNSHGNRDARSSEQGAALSDSSVLNRPMPLPSPGLSPKPTGYALPHPLDQSNAIATSPNALVKNASASHAALNSRVFPWDLQPLPPPKDSFVAPKGKGLRFFSSGEVRTACQQFSNENLIGDDGVCFNGIISHGGGGAKQQHQRLQEIVIFCLHENLHLGLKERLSDLYSVSTPLSSHLCKLVGFHNENGIQERYLVYEKLARGSLHSLLFETSDSRSLEWETRLKLIQGAIGGLASLEERFPEQALYRDFRLSYIQCDSGYNAKISGYWFVTSSSQTVHDHVLSNSNSARDNAYCAPETRDRGVVTWKSNVWSLGVVMLELLCGRKNNNARMAKEEKHNVLQWARPFLVEEDKLFLIMDPKLQGRFKSRSAKVMAKLILQCLQKDPARRPSMKMALEVLKAVNESRHTNMPVWKDRPMDVAPISLSAPLAASSPKPAVLNRNIGSYNRSPTKFDLIQSPLLKPLIIPARYCPD